MANSLTAFDAQVWSKSLVMNLDRTNVMLDKVNRQWDGVLNNVGDTVQVRTLGNITVTDYVRGQPITYEDLVPTKEALTVNAAKKFAFNVDDLDEIQNDINAINSYTYRAAVSMNNAIEDKILSAYTGALTANKITNSGSAIVLTSTTNGTSVYDNLVLARENLDTQNCPADMRRWVVVTPAVYSLLLKDTVHFIRSTDFADRVVQQGTLDGAPRRPGFVGMCAGFEVYQSTACPKDSGGRYLVYGTDMAIAYVAQLSTVEALRLESTFATAVRGLLLHDTAVFAEASKMLGYIYSTV